MSPTSPIQRLAETIRALPPRPKLSFAQHLVRLGVMQAPPPSAQVQHLTVADIQNVVAKHYRLPVAEMTSARRARSVARPRQIAMYLSKQLTGQSMPAIGRRFGNRDHTTVMHAVRQVERLRAADREIDDAVTGIMAGLAA